MLPGRRRAKTMAQEPLIREQMDGIRSRHRGAKDHGKVLGRSRSMDGACLVHDRRSVDERVRVGGGAH
jgi:hypothetical protein